MERTATGLDVSTDGLKKRIHIQTGNQRILGILFMFFSVGFFFLSNQLFRSFSGKGEMEAFYYFIRTMHIIIPFFVFLVATKLAFGRSDLLFDSSTIELRSSLFGMSRSKSYDRSTIKNLRVGSRIYSNQDHAPTQLNTIAFDYGIQSIHFATGISHAEASQIIELLGQKI